MQHLDPESLDRMDGDAQSGLPRTEPYVTTLLEQRWAGDDPQRCKALCCFLLVRFCGAPLSLIGRAFSRPAKTDRGHPKGQISRLVRDCEQQLRHCLDEQEIRDALARNKRQRQAGNPDE